MIGKNSTKTGSIVTINDVNPNNENAKTVAVSIEPIQDLHGYDKPWSGGAVNLFNMGGKVNTTLAGLTVTSDDDAIIFNGTKNGQNNLAFGALEMTLKAGTYYARAFAVGGQASVVPNVFVYANGNITSNILGTERSFTLSADTAVRFNFNFTTDGATFTNYKLSCVIKATSGIDKYYPYENICPISGHTECVTSVSGKNLFDRTIHINSGYRDDNGVVQSASGSSYTDAIKVNPSTTYTASGNYATSSYSARVYFLTAKGEWISRTNSIYVSQFPYTFTTPSNCGYIQIQIATASTLTNCQIEAGGTATDYEPYNGNTYTTDLGRTVYGGSLDVVSGELVVDRAYMVLNGTEKWVDTSSGRFYLQLDAMERMTDYTSSIYCDKLQTVKDHNTLTSTKGISGYVKDSSYPNQNWLYVAIDGITTTAELRAWLTDNPLQVCYPLATPQTYQLTPTEVQLIAGRTNNVWSNGSEITVEYTAQLPSAYAEAVQADSRDFLSALYMGGQALDCAVTRWTVTKGSVGSSSEFTTGNIISSCLQAEVKELTQAVKNQFVELRIGLMVEGAYEWITVGHFYVTNVENTIYSSAITGYGRIAGKSSGGFAEPQTKTLAQVARMIGIGIGCTVSFDTGINTSLAITEPMNGLTNYEALQVLTSVAGGYAVDTHDGNVKICAFRNTPTLAVNAGLMTSLPTVAEQDFAITGVRCTIEEASDDGETELPAVVLESGSPINLEMENKFMTDNLFQGLANRLIGYTYRPAVIDLSLGDPRIEGNDVLSVTDADGAVYTVPCHLVTHTYDGGLKTEITAVDATNVENSIGTMTPMQRAVASIRSSVRKAETIAQQGKGIAEDTNQYFWFIEEGGTVPQGVGTGAHITEVPQDDFLADPANGGGNLLARSNGVALRVGLVELLTLARDGISFDSSTPFTIGTEQAYITFSPTQNKIYIGGTNVEIGGQSLTQVLSDIGTLKQQVATVTDELGNIFELSIYTTFGTDTVTHRAELLKNGQDVSSLAEYVNDFEWLYKLNNQYKYIGYGRTITIDQATYAHAVTVVWTRRQQKYLLNNGGNNLITSTGAKLMGRTEY